MGAKHAAAGQADHNMLTLTLSLILILILTLTLTLGMVAGLVLIQP